ncbi:hypothetical protein F5877DRAFT_83237 [Lentinula edodes]|nr:hypothetical protein F5877DRAFT_83237 [Lentinula edodes]
MALYTAVFALPTTVHLTVWIALSGPQLQMNLIVMATAHWCVVSTSPTAEAYHAAVYLSQASSRRSLVCGASSLRYVQDPLNRLQFCRAPLASKNGTIGFTWGSAGANDCRLRYFSAAWSPKVEYWYGPRGIPTHAEMVIPFTVFSVGTRAVSDMAFLVCNLARSLITDEEPNANICSLSFEAQEDKGVGYVAFTGVSPFWFKRAETTPMFDVMQDSPDSFIMTWPLFRDDLTQDFHIVNTLSLHDATLGDGGIAKATQQMTSIRPAIESPEGIELLAKLLAFDNDSSFGPCVGAPRLLRWERAHYMNLNPPKDILPILESLKDVPDHPWYYSRITHLLNSANVAL